MNIAQAITFKSVSELSFILLEIIKAPDYRTISKGSKRNMFLSVIEIIWNSRKAENVCVAWKMLKIGIIY